MRRLLPLLVLAAFAAPALADPPQITADAGFDRKVKGGYIPVRVSITTLDEAFAGELRVPYRMLQGQALLARRVEVPPRSRSAFTLCVPVDVPSRQGVLVAASDTGREEIFQLDSRWVYGGRLVVVIGEKSGGFPIVEPDAGADPARPGPKTESTDVCYLEPAVAPAHWQAYQGVGLVVVLQPEPARFSPAQVHALTRWVELGGHVAVALGARPVTTTGTWLADLLPCEVDGNAELSGLGDLDRQYGEPGAATPRFAVARLAPHAGASTAAAQGPTVLACTGAREGGSVTALAFDYTAEPFRDRPAVRKLLAGLAAAHDPDLWEQGDMELERRLPHDLAALSALDWRLAAWLLALLALYLGALRPLQARLLAPPLTGRRVLLLLPGVPVLAAALVAVYVIAAPAGPLSVRTVGLVFLQPDSSAAETRTFRCLRSPDAQPIALRFADADAIVDQECGGQIDLVFSGGYRFRQEEAAVLEGVELAASVPRTFLTCTSRTLAGPLVVHVEREPWTVSVENRTGLDIADLRLAMAGHEALLGDLPAGETIPARLLPEPEPIGPQAPPSAWAAERPPLRDSVRTTLYGALDLDRAPADDVPKACVVTGWVRLPPDAAIEARGEVRWEDDSLLVLRVPLGKERR